MGPRVTPGAAAEPLNKWRAARGVGIVSVLSAAGLLGYRLFVSTPQYNGPEVGMQGKTVLVTEPNARPTRELLQGLARRGAQLILASENVDACAKSRDRLLKATRISASRVECRRLDLDSTRSVRRFAASLLTDYPKLDRVIIQSPSCVTGVVAGKRRPTHDGFEHQLGTNYFAAFLLSQLLWSRLSASGDGRLILVTDTDAAAVAQQEQGAQLPGSDQIGLPMDDLNFDDPNNFVPKKAYQRSQWFLMLFADELARRTANGHSASVLVANPRVSLGTAPALSDADHRPSDDSVVTKLLDFGARLIKRRVATTTLFCAVADPSVLQLTGPSTVESGEHAQSDCTVSRAAVYQDLRLIASPMDPQRTTACTRSAGRFLWNLSQKWTRLDTYPDPLPLPPRYGQSGSKTSTGPNSNASVPDRASFPG